MYSGNQMELAAALELTGDGRFRYALSYGALDEEAQGTWQFTGSEVRLHGEGAGPSAFTDIALWYQDGDLLLDRHGRALRFRRTGARCAGGR